MPLPAAFANIPDHADYTLIDQFLDSTAFCIALEQVSTDIWTAFAGLTGTSRFTRALTQVAQANGFNMSEDYIKTTMTGSVSEAYFITQVQAGRFWKDSFSASHGEYSHAFQWLAIAVANLGLASTPHALYVGMFRDNMKLKGVKMRTGSSSGEVVTADIHFWSYLCDAFATGRADDTRNLNEAPQGSSYRCPQTVMSYLFSGGCTASFLRFYLIRRYMKRGYLADKNNLKPMTNVNNKRQILGYQIKKTPTGKPVAESQSALGKLGNVTAAARRGKSHTWLEENGGEAFSRFAPPAPPMPGTPAPDTFLVKFHKVIGTLYLDPNRVNDVI